MWGRLHAAERGSSVSFEYTTEWLQRDGAFAIDPTSLPLQRGAHHAATLFGAIQDCGPDRWGRVLIERAVRKKVLTQKPYHEIDYVLALDDASRIGALRFRLDAKSPFLAATSGKLPPLVRLNALLRATDAIHSETETAQDLRFLLGAGSPLGGARPKSAVSLASDRLAIAKFPKPDDTRDIAAGEILALTLAAQAGIHVAEHRLVSVRNQVSPSSPASIALEKIASLSSLRPACWGCPTAMRVPIPCWLMASANLAMMSLTISASCGVASSSRCSPATSTTISAITVSSCANLDVGHSHRPTTLTPCRKWIVST
ncbi:MAG: HipA domain-containing protein [Limisphaerales bacterium]